MTFIVDDSHQQTHTIVFVIEKKERVEKIAPSSLKTDATTFFFSFKI